jgi:hypothetical protein
MSPLEVAVVSFCLGCAAVAALGLVCLVVDFVLSACVETALASCDPEPEPCATEPGWTMSADSCRCDDCLAAVRLCRAIAEHGQWQDRLRAIARADAEAVRR